MLTRSDSALRCAIPLTEWGVAESLCWVTDPWATGARFCLFRWDISVICPVIALKLVVAVLAVAYLFGDYNRIHLIFFSHLEKIRSVTQKNRHAFLSETGKLFANIWRCNEGAQFPGRRITMGAPNHCGGRRRAPKSPDNVTCTFFNAVHLLPKDLRFERGAPNLLLALGPIKTRYAPADVQMSL